VELWCCKMDGKSVDNVNIAISEPLCCSGTQLRPRESDRNSGSQCDGLGVSDDARFVTKYCLPAVRVGGVETKTGSRAPGVSCRVFIRWLKGLKGIVSI